MQFLSSRVGPGRARPPLEVGRNAGAYPQRKRIRGSGKSADFKPVIFRGFRDVDERALHGFVVEVRNEPTATLLQEKTQPPRRI